MTQLRHGMYFGTDSAYILITSTKMKEAIWGESFKALSGLSSCN